MNDAAIAELRLQLRKVLEAATTAGVTADVRMTLLVNELGREMAIVTTSDRLPKLVSSVQAAVELAANAPHDQDLDHSVKRRIH